jgi:hypothetical protein
VEVPRPVFFIKSDGEHLASVLVAYLIGFAENISGSHGADFSLPGAFSKVQVSPHDVKVARAELSGVGKKFGELLRPGLALAGPGREVFPLIRHCLVQLTL